jgi:hypothetical protein
MPAKCIDCQTEITEHDSNADHVCVDCQEYNYYHPEANMANILFRGVIEQQDGERSYTYNEYVLAGDLDEATRYFESYIQTWFGEDTRPQAGGEVWDSSWEVAAKLEYVTELTSFTVESADGGTVANVHLQVAVL